MRKISTVICGLSLLLGAAACTNNEQSATKESYSSEVKDEYREFKAEMSRNLEKVDAKIDQLQEKAKDQSKETKQALTTRIESLKELRVEIGDKLEDLTDSGQDTYADLKLNIKQKYETLENEVEKAFN